MSLGVMLSSWADSLQTSRCIEVLQRRVEFEVDL